MTSTCKISGLLPVLAILVLATPLSAQGSDNCSTAQVISGAGPFAFDLTTATTGTDGQGNLACNVNGSMAIQDDVWFRWTAPTSDTFILTTCLQTTVDTKVAIYAGTTCPPAAPVSCDDDSGSAQSVCRFFATAGQTFLFQVGTSPFGSPGTGTFRVLRVASSSTDDCSAAAALPSTGMYAWDDTLASTGTQGQSNPNCPQVHNDLWFTWVAPGSGMAHLNTCLQTNADTALSVYDGSGCPVANAIACDDDGCGLQSLVQWAPVAGNTYTFQIGLSGGISGSWGTFDIEQDAPPPNDDCSTPMILPGPGGTSYDNSTATTGSQGQGTACGPIQRDLWFTWTATTSGTATVETCFQTASNTILAVYAGSGCPTAAELGCNDDACSGVTSSVTVPISVGAPYTIQIGSPPGAPPGPASFTITETPGGGSITPFCFGDGTGMPCPCSSPAGAPGHGCSNSAHANGAIVSVLSGSESIAAADLRLTSTGHRLSTLAVWFQGDVLANQVVYGDGLRCVGSPLVRLYSMSFAPGTMPDPLDSPASPSIVVRGGITVPGTVKGYFLAYRDPAGYACSATFNASNALSVTWAP
jgi:hypothetical protein